MTKEMIETIEPLPKISDEFIDSLEIKLRDLIREMREQASLC